MEGANAKKEESAAIGTLAGRASSDAVTFRGESRASVVLNNAVVLRSADLSELGRARRGIVAPNAYAMEGANAKGKQSAAKGTAAGHASNGAVAFSGGAGELKLEPCVPSGIALRNDGVFDIGNAVASARVRAHAGRSHCGFVCTGESHGKAACVRFVVAAENRRANGKPRPTKPCPAVCGRKEGTGLPLRTNPPLLATPIVSFVWASLSSSGFNFSKTELRLLFGCFRDLPKW